MSGIIYQWIDLLWLPIALLAVHRRHWVFVTAFIAAGAATMRTQVELMEYIGYPTGFLPVFDTPLFTRGLIVYSIVYALYLLLAHYSKGTRPIVFFAGTLSFYFLAFCIAMVVMLI